MPPEPSLSPSTSQWVPILSVVVIIAALGTGGAIFWDRYRSRVVSETITRPAPEYGDQVHILLPDIDGAVQVVPDRPHDPMEVRSPDRFERIQRRRSFTVSTSSRGTRGPEFDLPAPGFRVLCIGDSVTFGWGVEVEQSYPALLAQALGVEVINAGVPAMKPRSMSLWFQAVGKDWDADLVLFARRPDWSGEGDPWRSFQEAVRAVTHAAGGAPVGVILPPVSTFDPMGSAQWEREYARAKALVAPVPVLELTEVFRAAVFDATPAPEGIVMETVGGTQRVLRHPTGEVLAESPAPPQGLGDPIVRVFEDNPDLSEPLFYDGGHPDQPGYALFAESVAAWVRALGWVPQGND